MRSKHAGQNDPSPTFISHSVQMNRPQRLQFVAAALPG
jgi:hypothetical protein